MNNELERIWKEMVVAKWSYYTGICLEGQRKITNTIIVFSPDSPAMQSRGSTGSGRESSSMLTSVEGNAVQAFCTRKNASN
jgi:hypothetical protein